jgi:hypothetical protein
MAIVLPVLLLDFVVVVASVSMFLSFDDDRSVVVVVIGVVVGMSEITRGVD